MKCEPGWPGRQSYASCTFLEPEGRHKRPGPLSSRPRHARLARRSPARPPPRHPRPWPGLRFTPRSGALLSPSDRPPSSTTSLLRLSFSLCSNLGAVSLSVRLSWSATSGHQRGWTPSGCPGVLRSCFPNWSCSLSAQVSDRGRRDRVPGLGATLGATVLSNAGRAGLIGIREGGHVVPGREATGSSELGLLSWPSRSFVLCFNFSCLVSFSLQSNLERRV